MTWSEIWKGIEGIDFSRETYIWRFYEMLLNGFDLKGKTVLEFGCGTGINSIFMAMRGAKVTFVDNSRQALRLVKKTLDKFGLEGELVRMDVFDSDFRNRFDLVHSEGLVEHFLYPKRQEIVDIHANAARKGGNVLLIIPHSNCPPYRLGKFIAEKTGVWIYGKEYPYTKNELVRRMKIAGLKPGNVLGGEFLFSLFWLFTPIALRSRRMIRKGIANPARPWWVRLNYGNWFANRWGRVIGCLGKKL